METTQTLKSYKGFYAIVKLQRIDKGNKRLYRVINGSETLVLNYYTDANLLFRNIVMGLI